MKMSQAKTMVREALLKEGLPLHKLSAKKTNFSDLSRNSIIIITVHGWTPDPRAAAIKAVFPKGSNYMVEFD